MNDTNLNHTLNHLIRELDKMNKTLVEIKDRLPEPTKDTLMEK